MIEGLGTQVVPKWLDVNASAASVKVLNMPARDDIDFPFSEQLIVEFYSK